MESQVYKIQISLLKDTQLKGVRAYMVLAKLQEYGEIISTTPGMEQLEQGDFGNTFEIIYTTQEAEHDILGDIQNISEIDNVVMEMHADNTPKSAEEIASTAVVEAVKTQPVQEAKQVEEVEKKYIVFQVGTEEFALPVDYVMSIERSIKITRVPNMPTYILGVINLRGIVIPVIDLKYKFSQQLTETTDATRIIICRHETMEVGFVVDGAKDVLTVNNNRIEAAPDLEYSEATDYIKSLIHLDKRIIILLDVVKLLKVDEIAAEA